MTVLVETGHVNEYPYNHARILWDNVITAMSATGAATGNPASAALTKTTYERWTPSATGDVLTGTFPSQEINSVAVAAHSDLSFTLEVERDGTWETITAFPFEGSSLEADFAEQDYRLISYAPDNEATLFLIKPRIATGVRITVTYSGTAPTVGVLMAGQVLEMQRPFYGGHSPALLSSDSTVRPNISQSGEWLGASQIRQGRNVAMSWENLKAPWVRKNFMPFSEALLTNPFVVAWNPKRFPDTVYCSAQERPKPSNSGTLNYQNITLNARAYSDGTVPEVEALDTTDFDSLFTFTRASSATEVGPSGLIREVATDVARFNHDPVTLEPLGLLIEEERDNIFFPSNADGSFGGTAPSFTADAVVSPDGTSNATLINEVTGIANRYEKTIAGGTYSTGQNLAFSWHQLRVNYAGTGDGSGSFLAPVAPVNATVDSGPTLLESLPNGWERWNVVFSITDGSLTTTLRGYFGGTGFSGGLVTETDPFAFWGIDIQPGSFPTSHIPTTTAEVTRAADDCSRTLGAEFNEIEGTFVIEISQNLINAIELSGTSSATVLLKRELIPANSFRGFGLQFRDNTSIDAVIRSDSNITSANLAVDLSSVADNFVVAFSYKKGETLTVSAQGQSAGSALHDFDTSLFSDDLLILGGLTLGTRAATIKAGELSYVRYFPHALTATEIQTLTGG